MVARQRDPALDAEQPAAFGAASTRALGMDDAAPGAHPVHRAGPDRDLRAERIAVHDLAVEEIGDGGEPDMGVRAHVHALAEKELGRAHLVPEDERPNHLAPRGGQRAAHLEAAEIAGAGHDHRLDGVAGKRVARIRVVGRVPAHGPSPSLLGALLRVSARVKGQALLQRSVVLRGGAGEFLV